MDLKKWAVEGSRLESETLLSWPRTFQKTLRNRVMWWHLPLQRSLGHVRNGLHVEDRLWDLWLCGWACVTEVPLREWLRSWAVTGRKETGLTSVGWLGDKSTWQDRLGRQTTFHFCFYYWECEQIYGRLDNWPTQSNTCSQLWLLFNLGAWSHKLETKVNAELFTYHSRFLIKSIGFNSTRDVSPTDMDLVFLLYWPLSFSELIHLE